MFLTTLLPATSTLLRVTIIGLTAIRDWRQSYRPSPHGEAFTSIALLGPRVSWKLASGSVSPKVAPVR